MKIFLYFLITILGLTSYAVGVKQMLKNTYAPSIFTRIVWLLLSINSFFGVMLSNSSQSSLLLSGIIVIGSLAICIVSFWKGNKTIGKLEYFCTSLLIISVLIWIFFKTPLINLAISLFAHFIGGLPTYKKVWINPKDESTGFWSLFFLSSFLSIFASDFNSLKTIIVPIYFTLFDGSMFFLTLRKLIKK